LDRGSIPLSSTKKDIKLNTGKGFMFLVVKKVAKISDFFAGYSNPTPTASIKPYSITNQ